MEIDKYHWVGKALCSLRFSVALSMCQTPCISPTRKRSAVGARQRPPETVRGLIAGKQSGSCWGISAESVATFVAATSSVAKAGLPPMLRLSLFTHESGSVRVEWPTEGLMMGINCGSVRCDSENLWQWDHE